MVVANPAYDSNRTNVQVLDRTEYHGTVVWYVICAAYETLWAFFDHPRFLTETLLLTFRN